MQKIKVAFCVRGAVAKEKKGDSVGFFKKETLYTEPGNYIDYTRCYNSIVKHIFKPNESNYEFDIFCHCWNTDLESEITTLYKPVESLFEDNRVYNEQITELCEEPADFGGISHALSVKKVIELKESYEQKTNTCYHIVFLYRYDLFLWKDIYLTKYTIDDNTINVNGHKDSKGDFHFIMNNNLSNKFKMLYDSVELGNKHKIHHWIKNFIKKFMKVSAIEDDIKPAFNQVVMRKAYEKSIKKDRLTWDLLESYGDNKIVTQCKSLDCPYLTHTDKKNNDGLYCCQSCKTNKGHGKLCEQMTRIGSYDFYSSSH